MAIRVMTSLRLTCFVLLLLSSNARSLNGVRGSEEKNMMDKKCTMKGDFQEANNATSFPFSLGEVGKFQFFFPPFTGSLSVNFLYSESKVLRVLRLNIVGLYRKVEIGWLTGNASKSEDLQDHNNVTISKKGIFLNGKRVRKGWLHSKDSYTEEYVHRIKFVMSDPVPVCFKVDHELISCMSTGTECSGNGECKSGNRTCLCYANWTGPYCEIPVTCKTLAPCVRQAQASQLYNESPITCDHVTVITSETDAQGRLPTKNCTVEMNNRTCHYGYRSDQGEKPEAFWVGCEQTKEVVPRERDSEKDHGLPKWAIPLILSVAAVLSFIVTTAAVTCYRVRERRKKEAKSKQYQELLAETEKKRPDSEETERPDTAKSSTSCSSKSTTDREPDFQTRLRTDTGVYQDTMISKTERLARSSSSGR